MVKGGKPMKKNLAVLFALIMVVAVGVSFAE